MGRGVEELVVDDVADGLQDVGGLVEDVVEQQVGLEGLVLVAEVEGVALVVQQAAQRLRVLRLLHLQVLHDHLHRQLLAALVLQGTTGFSLFIGSYTTAPYSPY